MTTQTKPQRKLTAKTIAIILGSLVLACILCIVILNFIPTPQTPTPAATSGQTIEQPAEQPTETDRPTQTPKPTNTPAPTRTTKPTNTSEPTKTPTPVPSPIVIEGKGDQILDINKWAGAAILQVDAPKNTSNFVIENYDAYGDQIDLLVNEIGAFSGTMPLDFAQGQETFRLQIQSNNAWTITIYPIAAEYFHTMELPGTYTGNGPDLIWFNGRPDIGKIVANEQSNVIVYSYGDEIDLLVNEIGPYEGQFLISRDTVALYLDITGDWILDVTTP